MLKKSLLIVSILFMYKYAAAQSESRMLIDSTNEPALYMEIDMSEDNVKEGIEDYSETENLLK